MKSVTRFVGLDVHAATISVAVSDESGETQSLGIIPNASVRWTAPGVTVDPSSEMMLAEGGGSSC